MGRIRSIKPEFPQSETIGRLSRDARLLFVQLWTVVDDDGRTRAASRMLASLLYPYDDDARDLIEGWLAELEREDCIVRYVVDGGSFLAIQNWGKHQKIDHKAKSKLPPPPEDAPIRREPSEILASPREEARERREPSEILAPDLGPRIKDRDQDQDQEEPSLRSGSARERATPAKRKRKIAEDEQPNDAQRRASAEAGLTVEEFRREWAAFRDRNLSNGTLYLDWDAAWRSWLRKREEFAANRSRAGPARQDSRDGLAAAFRETLAKVQSDGREQSQTHNHGNVLSLPVVPEVERPDGFDTGSLLGCLRRFP